MKTLSLKTLTLLTLSLLFVGLSASFSLAQPPEGETYVVQASDWLSKIADQTYGDPLLYTAIVEATNEKAAEDDTFQAIDNPNLIEVGQKLWLPAEDSLVSLPTPVEPGQSNPVSTLPVVPSEPLLLAAANATYQGVYDDPIQLVEGEYEGDPFDEDSLSRPIAFLIDDETYTASGDLNGDGTLDGVVIVAANTGGSGTFIYLAPLLTQDGEYVNPTTALLGDRVEITNITINEAGNIVLETLVAGPNDPLCCPTQPVRSVFALQDGELIELSSAVMNPAGVSAELFSAANNATYSGIYEEAVTLSDGVYEGEPFVEGGAARPMVSLVENSMLTGDLNGDGVDDAAVYLVENSGGSGVFTYLAVLLNQDGEYVNASTTLLGDRVQIKSATIRNQTIQLEMVIAGEDDPLCCPTQIISVSYALDDTGTLAETSFEELGQVSVADLFGTSWSLDRLDFETPILPDTEITLTIADDLISGLAGCNAYTAPLNVEGDPTAPGQSLDFGVIALTRRACQQDVMAQEMTYISALENVVQFSYQAGQLGLTYSGDDSFGTLYFNPVDGVQ